MQNVVSLCLMRSQSVHFSVVRVCVCVVFVCFRRYLALCVGDTRVRFDLQAPLTPLQSRRISHEKKAGGILLSPRMLRFLSQVEVISG